MKKQIESKQLSLDFEGATTAEKLSPRGVCHGGDNLTKPTIMETRTTFITNIFATADGHIFDEKGKEKKRHFRTTTGKKGGRSAYVYINIDGRQRSISIAKLVASAFVDGYDIDNDTLVYNDGNSFNVSLGNIKVVKPCDRYRYTRIGRMNTVKATNREKRKKELDALDLEWGKCSFPGLECTREGIFRYKGYPINSYVRAQKRKNVECRHRFLMINVDGRQGGKNVRITASKMVASAWKFYNADTDFIVYKDKDPTNIHADNLIVVGEKPYIEYMTRSFHPATKSTDEKILEYKEKCKLVIHDTQLTLDYLNTGNLAPINRYVEKEIIPPLMKYIKCSLRYGEGAARYLITSVIEVLYIKLDHGYPICNYLKFCKKTLDRYKKNHKFDSWMFVTPERPYSKMVRMEDKETIIKELGQKFNVKRAKTK